MVEYSRFVSEDEATALEVADRCLEAFGRECSRFDGSVVKTTGDGIVIEFSSVSQAVTYGVHVHGVIGGMPPVADRRVRFRIGIHIGEVERTSSDIFGHAVNVAARLMALAEPGGICVSHEAYQQARHNTPFGFSARGLTRLKNIAEPMPIYHVAPARERVGGSPVKLNIKTIGEVSVHDQAGLKVELHSEHMRALLGYLAVSPSHKDYKVHVAALLWSDRDAQSAKRAFGQCLRATAIALNALPNSPLSQVRDQVALDESNVTIDLSVVAERLDLGDIDDTLVVWPDWPEAILRGTEAVGGLYSSWLKVSRHNWRTKIADALEVCLGRFESGDAGMKRAATALLTLEPGHEIAVQKLISYHSAHNNLAMAVKAFRQFSAYILKHYQIQPSPATLSLLSGIGKIRADMEAAPRFAKDPDRAPILEIGAIEAPVLPDMPLYLAVGFRNELLANLARFREWIVQEALSNVVSAAAGKRVDYQLAFFCTRSADGIALSLRLLNAESQQVVWSEQVDIAVQSWLNAQKLVIRQIAARLQIYLSADRLSRIIGDSRQSTAAHDAWLRGENLLSLWTSEAEEAAMGIFSRIIDSHSTFAPAYASLASIHNVRHLINPGMPLDAQHDRVALPLAQKAAELDPLDARNHLIVAWASAMAQAYDKAAIHYELAMSLNPVSPKLLISAAQGLSFIGFSAQAKQLLEEALDLAPFLLPYQWCYVCSTAWMIGRYEDALSAAQRGEFTTIDTYGWQAAALSRLGREAEARAAFAKLVDAVAPLWRAERPPDAPAILAWFTQSFPIARTEDRELLEDCLRKALA